MDKLGGRNCIDEKNSLSKENVLLNIPFNSGRKRRSIVFRRPECEGTNQEVRVFTKGASERILELSSSIITKEGGIARLSQET